jgi:hypothetical protein
VAKPKKPSSTFYLGVGNGTNSAYDYCNRQRQGEGAYPSSLEEEHCQSRKNSGSRIYQQYKQQSSTLLRQEGSTQPLQTSRDPLQALTDSCGPLRTRKRPCSLLQTCKPTHKQVHKISSTHKAVYKTPKTGKEPYRAHISLTLTL